MGLVYEEKFPASQRATIAGKIRDVARRLDIDPNHIMIVFNSESAGKMTTGVTNSIGCIGLIQFCPDKGGGTTKTIQGVVYNLSDIGRMSYIEQIELCYKYWYPFRDKISDLYDLYLATFYPYAMDKPDSYKYGSQVSDAMARKIASQNPSISNGSTYITNKQFRAYIDNKIKKAGVSGSDYLRTTRKYAKRNWVWILGVGILTGVGTYYYLNRNK